MSLNQCARDTGFADLASVDSNESLNEKVLLKDPLQILLNQASSKYLTSQPIRNVESEAPAVDLELPITHANHLLLGHVIPEKLDNTGYIANCKHPLRPSSRLLVRIGLFYLHS